MPLVDLRILIQRLDAARNARIEDRVELVPLSSTQKQLDHLFNLCGL